MMCEIKSNDGCFSVNWALMNNCNYKCNYCHSGLNSGSVKSPSNEVIIDFVKKYLSTQTV